MNGKLDRVLTAARKTAVQAGGLAAAAARGAGRKTGELFHTARTRLRIAALEDAVEEALGDVGELLYATHTGNPTDSEVLQAKLQEVDALRAEIARLQGTADREEVCVCAVCGANNQPGDMFCRFCGGKL